MTTNDARQTTNGERRTTNVSSRIRSLLIGRWSLIAILLFALAFRLLLWSQPLHQLANDELEYVPVARDLLAGRGWVFYDKYEWLRAPLYPLFLAGSLWLAGGDLHRAALPNIVLSVATIYLGYRLAFALVGRRAALLAALIQAILWPLATFASLYMLETLFTFLFTAGLLVLVGRPTPNAQRPTTTDDHRCSPRYLVSWSSCHTIIAGVLFGLTTLTRSATLMFLPIIAIWLFIRALPTDSLRSLRLFAASGFRAWRRAIVSALLFVLCAAATIAPWTIRNYVAYGQPIAVETGLSFNLWFFNEPRESNNTIYKTLRNISNPAERSDYATAKGLARLREDPSILLRKLWPNWSALLRVKPIEDRFLQESYYGSVGMGQFTAALLLDDLLYVVILLASVVGLTIYVASRTNNIPPPAPRISHPASLVLAWIAYVVFTVLLTHGEGRYRQFLFPVLIPYAAAALVAARDRFFGTSAHPRTRAPAYLIIVPLWVIFLGTIVITYPLDWARGNVGRGWYTLVGDIQLKSGDQRGALQSYQRAVAIQGPPDAWLNVANTARALGEQHVALDAYNEAVDQTNQYIRARVERGDYLRELGEDDRARKSFEGRFTDGQEVTDWAWEHLQPRPRAQLDVGDDLDFGYVGGMYPAEQVLDASVRWTNGRGLLRLTLPSDAPSTGAALIQLRLAAPHPDGQPVPAQVCAASRCTSLLIGATWRTYKVPIAATPGTPQIIELRSATFDASKNRMLGVLVDTAALSELTP